MEAEGALIARKKGGSKSEFGGGMNVFERIVSEVEDFGGRDLPSGESVAQSAIEGQAWFRFPKLEGKEAKFLIEPEVLEIVVEKSFDHDGGVELRIGNDAECEIVLMEIGEEIPGAGHGPDRITGALIGDRHAFQELVSFPREKLSQDVANLDFRMLDP